MRHLLARVWDRGIVATFLTGLFVILPLAITFAIMAWVGDKIAQLLGPESLLGAGLHAIGLRFVTNPAVAAVIGWALVLLSIWLLGLLARSTARFKLQETFDRALIRIPVLGTVYGPIAQVVGMLQSRDREELQAMSVVYCSLGDHSAGILALLASEGIYHLGGQDCYVIYVPTSPVPLTGFLLFLPVVSVRKVDMGVEALMQVYFSLGVMAPRAIPEKYRTPPPVAPV